VQQVLWVHGASNVAQGETEP